VDASLGRQAVDVHMNVLAPGGPRGKLSVDRKQARCVRRGGSWKRDYGCRIAGHRGSGGITTGAYRCARQFSTLAAGAGHR